MKLSEAKKQTRFKLLQVGESGSGKTWRASSSVLYGRVLYVDLDDKLTGLVDKITAKYPKDIDKFEFEVYDHYDQVMKRLLELKKQYDSGEKPYATIVIDTWSRWHDLAIEKHLGVNTQKAKLTFDDWAVVKKYNRDSLNAVFDLPCNIIFNTHVGKSTDAADRTILTVSTTGSFGQTMPQFFNETHYLYYDMNKYKVQGCKASRIVANSSLTDEYFDNNGHFKVDDLSIFKNIAYRVE